MDEETTFKFIESVHGQECLWSVTSKAYKNKLLRDDLWKDVGKMFNMRGDEAYGMFRKLREKYRREAAKNQGKSGAAASQPSKWIYLKSLEFLDEAYKQRKTINSQEWGDQELDLELDLDDENSKENREVTPNDTQGSAKKRARSNTPGANCAPILDAMQSTTKKIIEAFQPQQPQQISIYDDIVTFVKGTFNALPPEECNNYAEEIMEISMQYRFKNKK